MSGYQIEVTLTALCPSCGEALAPGAYTTESRANSAPFERDNPFERKDRRVFITPCRQCFVHRSEVEASNNVQAAAPELYEALQIADEWIREAKDAGCALPAENTLRLIRAALSKAAGEGR